MGSSSLICSLEFGYMQMPLRTIVVLLVFLLTSSSMCISYLDVDRCCLEFLHVVILHPDGFMQRLKETNGTRLKLDQPKKVEGMQNETEGFLELLPSEADASNYQETETADSQFNAAEELQKNEPELENHPDDTAVQQGGKLLADTDHDQRDVEPREQQSVPRRPCHNQRGCRGTGGGRRGYSNGRGGRGSGRGSGAYQNGRGQYYDQPGNNYYSRSYYNNRGRGGRSSGHAYNNHGLTVKGGPASADVAS
ncbi:thioredoxin H7-like [Hibiscus syriacus]|uniref:Thioredoxin H7-like n=1 Tax=Hibiscus syriacus TaxID=106335 RepID=A0A6A3CST8_HIBSY|nr:thioredoxin H7-like [Hibiscus syriacus]